ncbi:MAG: hypothetical protein ACRCYT_04795 [Cetobacterium sp.]
MKTITDLLNDGFKKNEKYYSATSEVAGIKVAYSSNILNMKTVKEGTATAGSFCNKIMEIAFNSGTINVIEARTISDIFQRIALDSKHNGAGTSYKDSDWYRVSEFLNKPTRRATLEVIEETVLSILKDVVPTEIVEDDTVEQATVDSVEW